MRRARRDHREAVLGLIDRNINDYRAFDRDADDGACRDGPPAPGDLGLGAGWQPLTHIGNAASAVAVLDMIDGTHSGKRHVSIPPPRRTGDVGSCHNPCLSLVELDSSGPRCRGASSKPVTTSQ